MIDTTVTPGKDNTRLVIVRNQTNHPVTFTVSTENVAPTNGAGNGLRFIGTKADALGVRDWLHPDVTRFTVAPGQSKSVHLTIKVPRDASPGGHYAAMFVSSEPEGSNVSITTRIAVLVLLKVPGGIHHDLRVKLKPGIALSSSPNLNWTIEVENRGNVHENVGGTVVVNPLFSKAQRAAVRSIVAFPHSKRTIHIRVAMRSAPEFVSASFHARNWSRKGTFVAKASHSHIVLAPIWSILCLLIAVIAIIMRVRSRPRREPAEELDDYPEP